MKTNCARMCILPLLVALWAGSVHAAGSVPPSGQQSVDINGRPLAGCLLYVFQGGTVATPQNAYTDFGLTVALPNPMVCDQTGRLPFFYLADGSVHLRLTDASGVVVYDYPAVQVLGPSSGGGGGGGGGVDPTSIASTGDIKFRASGEVLTGWVRLNGLTIGSGSSGASGRANADTQNLFVYLWGICPNAHCPVSGGRGASGLADFNANKTITLPDFRGRGPMGLDDMGNTAANRIQNTNVTSGGGDVATTPNATGGEANHVLTQAELPVVTPSGAVAVAGHTHTLPVLSSFSGYLSGGGLGAATNYGALGATVTGSTAPSATFTGNSFGSGTSHNTMAPFMLGTWYVKL
jgi:hypothetical protein